MLRKILFVCLAAFVAVGAASAADLAKIERALKKEPIYKGTPKYLLLVFGPAAADRVWVVNDGDTLYVDRNGDGDLTAAEKKVSATIAKDSNPAEDGLAFEVGELKVGSRVHKGLTVALIPLKRYAGIPDLAELPVILDTLKADPKAMTVRVRVEAESARLKGAGVG